MHDREISILDSLSAAGKAALLERSIERSYTTGQVLWSAGDTPLGLTLVIDGKVRIVRGASGRQTVIHSGEAGATLGEIPFFTGSTYPATAVASEPTKCLIITRAAFDHALRVDPGLAYALLARLSNRVQSLVERVGRLTSHSVRARLAQYIIQRSSATSTPTFSLGMTQVELAEELGTVREVVVRALRELRESGAISPADHGRYVVSDLETLKRVAGIEA